MLIWERFSENIVCFRLIYVRFFKIASVMFSDVIECFTCVFTVVINVGNIVIVRLSKYFPLKELCSFLIRVLLLKSIYMMDLVYTPGSYTLVLRHAFSAFVVLKYVWQLTSLNLLHM